MQELMKEIQSPLFAGIPSEDWLTMLGCIGYHIGTFREGEIVAFEAENIQHVGICVDRSALTRELTKMKEDGLIDYDRNCFRIL